MSEERPPMPNERSRLVPLDYQRPQTPGERLGLVPLEYQQQSGSGSAGSAASGFVFGCLFLPVVWVVALAGVGGMLVVVFLIVAAAVPSLFSRYWRAFGVGFLVCVVGLPLLVGGTCYFVG